jgi:thiamine-phosphate diphosphorylase
VGAIFPSPTKKNAIRITKEQLQEITAAVSIPCVAIGGITPDNILELQGSGIAGVAVVSAIFAAENIGTACAALTAKTLFAVT